MNRSAMFRTRGTVGCRAPIPRLHQRTSLAVCDAARTSNVMLCPRWFERLTTELQYVLGIDRRRDHARTRLAPTSFGGRFSARATAAAPPKHAMIAEGVMAGQATDYSVHVNGVSDTCSEEPAKCAI